MRKCDRCVQIQTLGQKHALFYGNELFQIITYKFFKGAKNGKIKLEKLYCLRYRPVAVSTLPLLTFILPSLPFVQPKRKLGRKRW